MPIDGLTLHLLTEELNQSVAGTRIEKVYQPTADEVIFHLRSIEGAMKLLINVSTATPHMNLTSHTPENPPSPPMLCMFMRKHLTGCIIESIEQIDLDRICSIKLTGRNEIGDPVCLDLIIELMPKHANLIILNSPKNKLDDWTFNKSLQKMRESFRVSKEIKEWSKTVKR